MCIRDRGYGDAAYTGGGYGGGAGYGGYQATGYGAGDSGAAATSFVPEFMPAGINEAANDGPAGTPRPVGRLSIFTLLDDKAPEFDLSLIHISEPTRLGMIS